MNCHDAAERLSDLLEGSLAPGERAAVDTHLRGCAPCEALRARLERVVEMLADLAGEPAPAELADRVLARIPRPAAPGRGPQGRLPWELRRVAGWALILLGIGWQAGGNALAGRAATEAAPMIAEARQAMARARKEGLAGEIERASTGMSGLARGFRNTQRVLNSPATGRPAT